jgi:hypothetical protein
MLWDLRYFSTAVRDAFMSRILKHVKFPLYKLYAQSLQLELV